MIGSHTDVLRLGAALAAVVLAVLSRGDTLMLASLLVIAAARPAAVAVVPALVAASWRWGSTSLDALAGAQAVLGPAGFVGPTTAALGTWLAAVAVLLSTTSRVGGMGLPNREAGASHLHRHLLAVAVAATVAAVAAGPAPGGRLWIRVLAGVVAWGCALGLGRLRERSAVVARVLDATAAVTGVGALIVISREAPTWAGTFDAGAARESIAIALAVTALVAVGARLRHATPQPLT